MQRSLLILAAIAVVVAIVIFSQQTQRESSGEVFFIEPNDGAVVGAVVKSPFKLVFGAKGLVIVPAGTEHAQGGHHHLLIDTGLPPLGEPIAKDDQHRHFGGGQTEAEISLEPGTHSLQMLLGDHNHISHDSPVVSRVITVTVEE